MSSREPVLWMSEGAWIEVLWWLLALAFSGLLVWGGLRSQGRLERIAREWAARCRLEVLEIAAKDPLFGSGSFPYPPSRYDAFFRLRVRSSDGLERTAWLRIHLRWFRAPDPHNIDVMWQQGPDRFTSA